MTNGDLATQGAAVKRAATALAQASDESRAAVLRQVADQLEVRREELLALNAAEVAAYEESGPGRDRLTLTNARVDAMANALREIADAPDPLFERLDASTRPNGLRVERLRVPLGVIGVVYENRPNVTSDVAGLCVRKMCIRDRVWGLRAVRALRSTRSKDRNPDNTIFSLSLIHI